MTVLERIITILAVVAGTMVTRFLPFIVFPADKKLPDYIKYLGNVLPNAVIGFLVVYSFKGVSFVSGTHGVPEVLSLLIVAALHLWKRSMLISIASGTIAYMLMVQVIF
ncbi:AzlD domain-containing protein [Lachnospiraceae bacterium NSJ-143]|nr:AzlD domain-containing protein [Lachnospiraceae bacterium NSJ-143]